MLALSAIGAFTAFIASMTLLLSTPFRLTHALRLQRGGGRRGDRAVAADQHDRRAARRAGCRIAIPAGLLGGIGMGVSIAALLLIAFMPADPSYFDIAWRMALCGSGFGMFLPPNARLIIGCAPRERAAAAGGLVSTVRLVGQTTGATLVAALLALGVGAGAIPPLVAAGLALVAGLCSLARLRPSIRNPPTRRGAGRRADAQDRRGEAYCCHPRTADRASRSQASRSRRPASRLADVRAAGSRRLRTPPSPSPPPSSPARTSGIGGPP